MTTVIDTVALNDAAVEIDDLAGQVSGFLGRQESDQLGDFGQRSRAPHRHQGFDGRRVERPGRGLPGDDPRRDDVDGDPARGQLQRQGLGRAMQAGLGGGIIGLAAIAGHARQRGDVDDAAPAGAHHRQQQRLGHIEEALQAHVDHPPPLRRRHSGHGRVVVNAGVVNQYLNGPASSSPARAQRTCSSSVTSNAVVSAEPPAVRMASSTSAARSGCWCA